MAPEAATMKIDIPGVDFGALARQAIAERLTESLVGADDAIRKIVVAAMQVKVGSDGKVGTYASHNDTPYVEWLAQDLVRQATRAVLARKVEALRPAIERAVEDALKSSLKAAAKALTEAFIASARNSYTVDVGVTFKERAPR